MSPNRYQKVISVSSRLQAAILQSTFEAAGIPVNVTRDHNGGYMNIWIPAEHAFDADNILKTTSLSVERIPAGPYGYF